MEIVVLFGGESGEREVSLRSGERVAAALRARNHRVMCFEYRFGEFSPDAWERMRRADAVFLALHGGTGEDGTLQAMLEEEGVRQYTGSSPQGAALAMDKAAAKRAVAAAGVPVAAGCVWLPEAPLPPLSYPAVLKPLTGGSSLGLVFAENAAHLAEFCPKEPYLCEEYLPGAEYTVGILEGEALPVVEIRPVAGAYDYAHKYAKGGAEELCPAPISAELRECLQSSAATAFHALKLRDYARMDFKMGKDGTHRFLEANTLPGMTETSLLPLAAERAGLGFPLLCERMAAAAAARKRALE